MASSASGSPIERLIEGPNGMAEKQKPKPKPTKKMTQAEQSERFKETARKLGCRESGRLLSAAFRKVVFHRKETKG